MSGGLSLASEMNGGNIRLHMTLKINVGCLSLASEMNGGNIRLRMGSRMGSEMTTRAIVLVCSKIFTLVIFVTGAIKALSGAKSLAAPVYFFCCYTPVLHWPVSQQNLSFHTNRPTANCSLRAGADW